MKHLEYYIFHPEANSDFIEKELVEMSKDLSHEQKVKFKPYIVMVRQSLRNANDFRATFNRNSALDTIVSGLFVDFFSTYILVNGRVKRLRDPEKSFYQFVMDQTKKMKNKYSKRRDYLDKYLRSLAKSVRATIESFVNIKTALQALKQIK